mmetsp:Transcript_8998/g.16384  ORF Transcript_8998/g.16384 Transcript_8998/m.16384 type:complete len:206 (-) Transcript_8998:64-681(-)
MGKGSNRVRVRQVGGGAPGGNPLESLAVPQEEMINLPPKPDSNMTHVWPMSETFSMDYKRFSVLYPSYIDSTKSHKYGRRIAKENAVERPSVVDLGEALRQLKIRHAVQPHKGFSPDAESRWDNPGRILVDMTMQPSKKQLLEEAAEMIKTLPIYTTRIAKEAEQERKIKEEEEEAAKAAQAKALAAVSSNSNASTKKKKGKKKR